MPVDQFRCLALEQRVNIGSVSCTGRLKPELSCEMRRQRRHGKRSLRQRFTHRKLACQAVNLPSLHQGQQQPVSLLFQPFGVASGIDEGRGIGQHSQHGGLCPCQVGRAATGVPPGSSLDADSVSAERGIGGIELEDTLFRAEELQLDCREHFNDLAAIGAFRVAACHPRHLHGDGAAAPDRFACPDITGQCFYDRNGIDPRVPPEPAVLVVDEAGDIFFRQAVGRGESPLAVGSHTGAQEGAVISLHHGREGCTE